ncbi:hypothetical protein ANN_23142 [Periplaneta americana]|uniref:Uncharacterized protein n=1 Tax=Periplaneta americana TaxID=6978 RepID=A0ABQ8SM95_PERAM|nr:hypothetical protein ANN_23142 [Periplaneta americana]
MDTLEDIVKRFQKEMTERYNSCVGSYNRSTIGNEGKPNRKFFVILFTDIQMSVKFLQEVGLMKTSAKCKKCGIQMKLNTKCDKWRCNKKSCNTQLTTRYESLFNNSNLTYEEIMFLLYEILNNMPGNNIKQEYNFDDHTLKLLTQPVAEDATSKKRFLTSWVSAVMENCSESTDIIRFVLSSQLQSVRMLPMRFMMRLVASLLMALLDGLISS